MPDEMVQIHAYIPHDLKKRAFIALAERDTKFTPWLKAQLENLLRQPPHDGATNAVRVWSPTVQQTNSHEVSYATE